MRYARRRFLNRLALILAFVAMAFGLFWLAWILVTLITNALPALQWNVFSQMTPPPGGKGGLLNAIYGTIILTTTATVIGTPIGILAGTYLAEIGKDNGLARLIRFVNGILLSAPSVVIGFFIYWLIVARSGHFSGWAGVVALMVILIPVVVNSTENMLRLVPNSLREAAAALGAPQYKITLYVAYRAARSGVLTGILLATARISGETAPLLFTSLNNQFWNSDMSKPMANLPVVIFQFAMSPYQDWQSLAWAGAFLITVGVLTMNVFARLVLRNKNVKN